MAKIPYKKPPKKVKACLALAALLGSGVAANYAINATADFEGYVPEGYVDPVGIPTKCWGDTRNVIVGHEYSFEECSRSLNEHMVELVRPLTKCISGFASLPDKTKAAIASMTYNIGSGAMCKSSIVKKLNAGDLEGACKRMKEIYKYARDRRTNEKVELPGLRIRRNYEGNMCLQGLKEKQSGG